MFNKLRIYSIAVVVIIVIGFSVFLFNFLTKDGGIMDTDNDDALQTSNQISSIVIDGWTIDALRTGTAKLTDIQSGVVYNYNFATVDLDFRASDWRSISQAYRSSDGVFLVINKSSFMYAGYDRILEIKDGKIRDSINAAIETFIKSKGGDKVVWAGFRNTSLYLITANDNVFVFNPLNNTGSKITKIAGGTACVGADGVCAYNAEISSKGLSIEITTADKKTANYFVDLSKY